MFTGIVEGLGTVRSARRDAEVLRVAIDAAALAAGLRPGSSIAVNGCCLTVETLAGSVFTCALSEETVLRTRFNTRLVPGTAVNLERALRADGRLEGHIVQGHVDGVGTIAALERSAAGSALLAVDAPAELQRYLALKGSVAVDGISLTVASLDRGRFGAALIPYTLDHTNLASARPGDPVNLETDILARYVERLGGRSSQER